MKPSPVPATLAGERKEPYVLKQFSKVIAAVSVAALVAVGCGSEDEPGGSAQPTPTGADEAADTAKAGDDDSDQVDAADEGDASGGPTGGGSGTIDLDGEIIELSSVRCHLESQPAAAGGGNILFVVQGEGQDSAGEPVLIDISRFDEDSMFAGDDVQIYIGEITMAGDAVELAAKVPAGTVTLDGGTARVDGLLVEDLASGTSATASIEISC